MESIAIMDHKSKIYNSACPKIRWHRQLQTDWDDDDDDDDCQFVDSTLT